MPNSCPKNFFLHVKATLYNLKKMIKNKFKLRDLNLFINMIGKVWNNDDQISNYEKVNTTAELTMDFTELLVALKATFFNVLEQVVSNENDALFLHLNQNITPMRSNIIFLKTHFNILSVNKNIQLRYPLCKLYF